MNKLLKLSIVVLLGAAVIAWYDPSLLTGNTNPFVKYHHVFAKLTFLNPVLEFFGIHHGKRPSSSSSTQKTADTPPEPVTESSKAANEPTRVFTKEELAKYKGEEEGGKIYIAILGKVFDVTRGKDYYGPGGGYAFFSGIDGSRAFVTGTFTAEGLIDDIEGLEKSDYVGLRDWADFYMKDYTYIGKVEGKFYDINGNPTKYYYQAQKWIKAASKYKEEEDIFKEKFPMCNVDYKPEEGTRVWCSNASGGVKRDWVGFPRSLYSAEGSKNVRCACAQESDLDDPLLKPYPNCPLDAVTCQIVPPK
uniref:EOG090X0A5G n=1 Tax=Eubosmina coregoni TaxID=186181 RepID=A0A4Y7LLF0_9CRUS|nr:EOG090X0A5G [Eubosmina coregoni]SVE69947.1 EOG090X0A5G [Eubosmina coregoni]